MNPAIKVPAIRGEPQLRRNTDRFSRQRLGQVALAVALILTVKLVKWAKRWTD